MMGGSLMWQISSLIGPAVVAVVISGTIAIIGFLVNRLTSLKTHKEKLHFDRELAEKKVTADIALAEKKLALDQALVIWRRRYEIAEQVLTAAYEARDILNWARTPVRMSGEGETRQPAENESDALRNRRNSYFVPIERLTRQAQPFAKLQTLMYAAGSHFGPEAIKPIEEIGQVHAEIMSTAGILIEIASFADDPAANQQLIPSQRNIRLGAATAPAGPD